MRSESGKMVFSFSNLESGSPFTLSPIGHVREMYDKGIESSRRNPYILQASFSWSHIPHKWSWVVKRTKSTRTSATFFSGYAHSSSVVYFIDTILYLNQVFVTVSLNHYEVDKVAGCCCFSLFINCILVPLKPQIKVTFQHRCHALLKIQLLSSMYWKLASTLPHWWQEVVHSRLLSHSESVLKPPLLGAHLLEPCWLQEIVYSLLHQP